MNVPIRDEDGNIIGMCFPDFLDMPHHKPILYRLIRYACTSCEAEYLMDEQFVRSLGIDIYALKCPVCGEDAEAEASTSEEQCDELSNWGCAYPNHPTPEEEEAWYAAHPDAG